MSSVLKEIYKKEIAPELQKEFKFSSVMQIPKLEKIVINAGIGDAANEDKNLDAAVNELLLITGQTFLHKPQSIHLFLSITGYLNPSLSSIKLIALLGQTLIQVVQPVHNFFDTISFIILTLL